MIEGLAWNAKTDRSTVHASHKSRAGSGIIRSGTFCIDVRHSNSKHHEYVQIPLLLHPPAYHQARSVGYSLLAKSMTDWTDKMANDTLELHPLCTLFPRITGDEYMALVEDIKANGLRESIVLHESMVIDGGNRYRACLDAGIEPHFVGMPSGDVISFVLSANLHRRHLTAGQHAAIISSITNWSLARKQGAASPESASATLLLSTVAERAKASGTSERTQRTADKVARENPELAQKVAQGEVSLAQAAASVSPVKVQEERQQEAAQAAEDAYGDIDLEQELTDAHAEIAELQSKLELINSDSPQGELLKMRRSLAAANNERDRQIELLAEVKKKARFNETQLKRIGRLVGESDTDKVADAVERALKARA